MIYNILTTEPKLGSVWLALQKEKGSGIDTVIKLESSCTAFDDFLIIPEIIIMGWYLLLIFEWNRKIRLYHIELLDSF